MNAFAGIDLSVPGSPSLFMRDLSEFSTLPFLAAFDVQPSGGSTKTAGPQKRITYIGLVKKTMPLLVELFSRFKDNVDIYADGTLETVLSVRVSRLHTIVMIFYLDPRPTLYPSK